MGAYAGELGLASAAGSIMEDRLNSIFRVHSHRRLNPLTDEWVLVSPHRNERPWQGATERVSAAPRLEHDPTCYLCPGNRRAKGIENPLYASTFVFENDYAALKSDTPVANLDVENRGLMVSETEAGICRVMCFSPRHDLNLASMSLDSINEVVRIWVAQSRELAAAHATRYTQIFENRGEMMGASNPHPHCQIWATSTVPEAPSRELACQKKYLQTHNACLLCDYVAIESSEKERLVCSNDSLVAVVPFWAVWPFEILLCSKRHFEKFTDLTDSEISQLSAILKQIVSTYDRVFDVPFPYSMGFHQTPSDGSDHPEWHFHAHFYPPLLRSASVRKFMVGFEMLGTPQRDITPEAAAERLRSLVPKL